jgi:dTDP-4-dehydrorhamnose 3,5-epimerase-like enzyme
MIFSGINLTGAYTVDIDRREDNRGYFARVLCEEEFSARVSFLNSRRWLFTTLTQLIRDTALRWLQADTRHTHTRQRPLR